MFLRTAAIGLIALVSISAAAPPAKVADLGWMSGAWVSESKGEWVEELWTSPRGGMLLGTNRSGKGARATGFEFMRISSDAYGTLTYWASPSGKHPVPFRLFSSAPNQVAFEDSPQRLSDADRLPPRRLDVARGDLRSGGNNTMTWTFRRPRSK